MTETQEILIVVLILSINTCIAIGYFLYGFLTLRKRKRVRQQAENEKKLQYIIREDLEAKEREETKKAINQEEEGNNEQLTKAQTVGNKTDSDDTEEMGIDTSKKTYSLTKYVILSIFIFLCPMAGIIFLMLGTLFYRIFFDSSIDLAAITFSKERVDIIDRPDIEEEINLVPLEEAIMIDDKENLRQLLLTVLRGDVSKSIGAVTKALNSADSEASHYAASAIMDINNEFQNNLQKFHKQLNERTDDFEIHQLYIEYLIQMLNAGFLSELELKTYVYMLGNHCSELYEHHKDYLKVVYYTNLINLLSKIHDLQAANTWVERLCIDYPNDIEMYRCVLHFYFETQHNEMFFKYLNQLKSSEISIDKDLLELIRVFQ